MLIKTLILATAFVSASNITWAQFSLHSPATQSEDHKANAKAIEAAFKAKSEKFVSLPETKVATDGYYTYGEANSHYGNPEVVKTIQTVASVMKSNQITMGVGIISKRDASPMDFMKNMKNEKERNSYRSGTEFFLRYIHSHGDQKIGSLGHYTEKSYNRDATLKMLKAFIDANSGKIQEINLDDTKLADLLKDYAKEKGLTQLTIQSLGQRRHRRESNPDFIVVRYSE